MPRAALTKNCRKQEKATQGKQSCRRMNRCDKDGLEQNTRGPKERRREARNRRGAMKAANGTVLSSHREPCYQHRVLPQGLKRSPGSSWQLVFGAINVGCGRRRGGESIMGRGNGVLAHGLGWAFWAGSDILDRRGPRRDQALCGLPWRSDRGLFGALQPSALGGPASIGPDLASPAAGVFRGPAGCCAGAPEGWWFARGLGPLSAPHPW